MDGIRKCRDLCADDEAAIQLEALIELACSLGASQAAIISADQVWVEEQLADICANGRCKNYGLSPGCPPHVAGPAWFRELQSNARYGVVFRIIAPSAALFSDECTEIMKILHVIAAAIELAAVRAGYPNSKGFAGGSCKKIFCHDRADCRVLAEGAECPHRDQARPSMSGFGINVSELMKVCGWPADIATPAPGADAQAMSWVAGLVLIG